MIDAPPKGSIPTEHVLYVVLHGLICLVDVGKSGFVAHILEIGEEHEYLFGNWLLESPIPERAKGQDPFRARLVGVDPGIEHLDCKNNAIVELPDIPCENHPNSRALIEFPRPQRIDHFLSGAVQPAMFSTLSFFKDKIPPMRVAAIRVLRYTFPFKAVPGTPGKDEVNDVALVGKDGTPLWTCPTLAVVRIGTDGAAMSPCDDKNPVAKYQKTAVLHIFNEPGADSDDPDDHNLKEFQVSTAFLGVELKLNSAPQVDDQNNSPLPGLLQGELEPLSARSDSVLNLLVAARSGQDTEPAGGSSGPVCNGCNANTPSTGTL